MATIGVVSIFFCWYLSDGNSSYRDMATGAFSGLIIGAVILLYEEYREERREKTQAERDRKLAAQIREDSNDEADLRALCNYLLMDLKPFCEQFFHYLKHSSRLLPNGYEKFVENQSNSKWKVHNTIFYVERVDNEDVIEKFNAFEKANLEILKTDYSEYYKGQDGTFLNSEIDSAIRSLYALIVSAEALLNSPNAHSVDKQH